MNIEKVLNKLDVLNSALDSSLGYYYDNYTGRFAIPIDDIDCEKSEILLSLLERGYAMTSCDIDGIGYYTIFSLDEDCRDYRNIDICKEKLKRVQGQFNFKYFDKVSLEDYNKSMDIQRVIDYILLEMAYFMNQVEGYSIVLIKEEGYFKFIEALDVCI